MDLDRIISNAITDTVETFGEDNVPRFFSGISSETATKAKDYKLLMEYSNNLLYRYHSELQKALLDSGVRI